MSDFTWLEEFGQNFIHSIPKAYNFREAVHKVTSNTSRMTPGQWSKKNKPKNFFEKEKEKVFQWEAGVSNPTYGTLQGQCPTLEGGFIQ